MLGEPTDLDPYDSLGDLDESSTGFTRLLQALNRAQVEVARWRDRQTGRFFRFRGWFREKWIEHAVTSGTVDTGSTTTTVTSTTQTGMDGEYVGYVMVINSESRPVVSTSGSTFTLGAALSSAPSAADSYSLVPRWLDIPTDDDFVDVVKLYDPEKKAVLAPQNRGVGFSESLFEIGDPGFWWRIGSRIYLDRLPNASRWFLMEMSRVPTKLTTGTDVSELPIQHHEAVTLWATAWGLKRMQEYEGQYAMMRAFEDVMKTNQTEIEDLWQRYPEAQGAVNTEKM